MDFETDPDFSEVCLVGQDLTEFSAKKLGPYIRRIDLSFNALGRVRGFEICSESLEELILDNNQLKRLELRADFPLLHTLSLNKNQISDVDSLIKTIKEHAKCLRYLSFLGNPGCPDQLTDDFVNESDYQVYRYHVLHHLSRLRFLDFRQVTQKELNESKKEIYESVRVLPLYTPLRLSDSPVVKPGSAQSPSSSIRKGKNAQGKQRLKYLGKNSEGNRFIKDSDL